MSTRTAPTGPAAAIGSGPARVLFRRPAAGLEPGLFRPPVRLAALLAGTALLYLWGLSASGWANSFYSAAAQAGSVNWEAFFFGSSDAANSITVDKPPASLWVMAMSVRLFGLSSWSILVPQALMGVAAVAVIYATVARVAGRGAGLLAGVVLALTPVATLMFRFNNPDALLVLLMSCAAWATLRAIRTGRVRWMVLCGVLIGTAFLTKQLQALLVVPGFALAWLVCAPASLGRTSAHRNAATGAWLPGRSALGLKFLGLKFRGLAGAAAGLLASAGWWIAAVELTPAQDRPWIGGSQTNSVLELTFGYNGLGRLSGDEVGSVGGGTGGSTAGLFRLFTPSFGGQVSWLLPSALILLAGGLWYARRSRMLRASLLVWGSWLVVTGLVFSFMAGIIHEYYTVALAPALAAVVGLGASVLWRRRHEPAAAALLGAATLAAGVWAFVLLSRTDEFLPWLRWPVLAAGLAAGVGLAAAPWLSHGWRTTTAVLAVTAALTGPAAYSVETAATAHTGAIVTAGPALTVGRGGAGFTAAGQSGFGQRRFGGFGGPGGLGGGNLFNGNLFNGQSSQGGLNRLSGPNSLNSPGRQGSSRFGGLRWGGTRPGASGGLLNAPNPSAALISALTADASSYSWAGAVVGSNNAAGYQLATRLPVMPVGGFNGTDPSPSLVQFQQLVAGHRIHYWISGGIGMAADSGSNVSAQIGAWVQQNFTPETIGGTTVYDLSQG